MHFHSIFTCNDADKRKDKFYIFLSYRYSRKRISRTVLHLMNIMYYIKCELFGPTKLSGFSYNRSSFFVLKLIAYFNDISTLSPYKTSKRKDHKTRYQLSKLSGIWAAFSNNCLYRIVMRLSARIW